jgi:ABC-type amino acid transport substrate-binding protein
MPSRQRGLDFTPVTYEDLPSVYGAYEEGRCDAATSDKSQLAGARTGFADPTAAYYPGYHHLERATYTGSPSPAMTSGLIS